MTTPLTTLMMRLEAAQNVLALLEETNADAGTFEAQRVRCRCLREQLNALVPDSETYDCRADNVVAVV